MALVSMEEPFTVTEENFLAKNKINLYIGLTFPCTVKKTISRGQIVFDQGVISDQSGGQWTKPSQVKETATATGSISSG